MNEVFKWYALHKILVHGSLRVPFIIVSTVLTKVTIVSTYHILVEYYYYKLQHITNYNIF